MQFFAKHGEKFLLFVLILGLVASVVLGVTSMSALVSPKKPVAPEGSLSLDVAELDATLARLTNTPPVLEVAVGSFTPELRKVCVNVDFPALIPIDAEVCPFCGVPQDLTGGDTDGDGIPDKQENIWGMDPANPNDAFQDTDGDGFPTLYEFERETSPIDPNSSPDPMEWVRLKEVNQSIIEFELRGTAKFSEAWTLQLWWKYPGERRGTTKFVRTGTKFGRNNEFTAESFTEKTAFIDGKNIDQSVAIIRSGRDTVKLGRNRDNSRGDITESSAVLATIFGPEWEQVVRLEDRFELGTKSYMIVDIRRDAVVAQPDADSGSMPDPIVIVETSPEDQNALEKYKAPDNAEGADAASGAGSVEPTNLQDFF